MYIRSVEETFQGHPHTHLHTQTNKPVFVNTTTLYDKFDQHHYKTTHSLIWQILKIPLLFRDVSFIEDIFITCCVFHNWLLDYDAQFMTSEFRVTGLSHDRRRVLVNNVARLLQKNDDYSYTEQGGLNPETVTQVDSEFHNMRNRLATHTYYMFRNRLI